MRLRPLNLGAMSRKRQWLAPTLVGTIITLLFLLANIAKPQAIERVSDLFFDSLQRQYPRQYNPDTPVRIIDIDDESIRRIGQWPWPRTVIADLNSRLADAGAGVIAYDIVFAEPDRTSPENIIEVLNRNPNATEALTGLADLKSHDNILAESFGETRVVTALFLLNSPTQDLPDPLQGFSTIGSSPAGHLENFRGAQFAIPELYEASSGAGSVTFRTGGDGVIRSAPLLGRIGDRMFPSLSAEALRVVQNASSFAIKSSNAFGELENKTTESPEMVTLRIGDFEVPTTADGKIVLHYTTPQPQRYIPAWKILSDNPADQDWGDKIAGHIVCLLYTSPSPRDATLSRMPSSA